MEDHEIVSPLTEDSESSRRQLPLRKTIYGFMVALLAILLCCPLIQWMGGTAGLATLCSIRYLEVSPPECLGWAVTVRTRYQAEYRECLTDPRNFDPSTADDAVLFCLEERGLGPE
jgi:hypothetical protein